MQALSEHDGEGDANAPAAGPTYVEEQEEYRQAFLQARPFSYIRMLAHYAASGPDALFLILQEAGKALQGSEADDAFGGVLMMKKKKKKKAFVDDVEADDEDKEAPVQTQALLDSYFGKDDKLDQAELFLKDFIRKQVKLYCHFCGSDLSRLRNAASGSGVCKHFLIVFAPEMEGG